MTEDQQRLMPYVSARIESIIRSKEERKRVPLIATENEIVSGIRGDVLECMRELYRKGIYTPTNTLNSPALMKKEI